MAYLYYGRNYLTLIHECVAYMVSDGSTAAPAFPTIRPRHVGTLYVEIPLFGFGLAVLLAVLIPGILQRHQWGFVDMMAAFLGAAILFCLASFLWMDFVQLSAALTPNVLHLPYYLPPSLRTRRRSIALSQIADVMPSLDGVDMYLRDGSRLFLDRRYFGVNGAEVVTRLSSRVGKSYRDVVEDALRKELMQVTLDARMIKGHTIYLSRSLFSYSGRTVLRIHPSDIVASQPFQTKNATAGYRMELTDGSPFFISEDAVTRLRLRADPIWAAKIPQVSMGS